MSTTATVPTVDPGATAVHVAVVTGAGGGIGQAVVTSLAAQGMKVAALDLDQKALDRVVSELVESGARVRAYCADVTSGAGVEQVVDQIERDLGPIDYLVNAAGILRTGAAVTLSEADWSATFAVNTTGVFNMSRAVVSRMMRRRSGAVVTIASNSAHTPRWHMAAYAASKAAAASFTKTLGLEAAPYGIRCNVVAPGSTDTAMLTSLWADGEARRASIEGTPETFRLGIPLGKLARPSDVADAIVFLLSEQASHITMHDLTVDGGAALGH